MRGVIAWPMSRNPFVSQVYSNLDTPDAEYTEQGWSQSLRKSGLFQPKRTLELLKHFQEQSQSLRKSGLFQRTPAT